MFSASSHLDSENPQRLMTRLGRHWRHKFHVTLGETRLDISFSPESQASIQIGKSGLDVTIETSTKETLEKLQTVVSDHLQRFAGGEVMTFHWQ